MRLLLALIGTAHGAANVTISSETVAGLETKGKNKTKTSDGVLATMALFDVKHQAPHYDLSK